MAEPRRRPAACPQCCRESHQVHSRYRRTLADLPWQGRAMIIMVTSRRFRCGSVGCPRRVFVERFPEIAPPHARRTNRLAEIQRHVCLALGSASGARLARRLGLSVSGSTLLRLVCRGASSRGKSAPPLRAIGIDDWAWKRGHRYGSIVCDLERRRIVDLLPDPAGTTVEEWLSVHPGIASLSTSLAPASPPIASQIHRCRALTRSVRRACTRARPPRRSMNVRRGHGAEEQRKRRDRK